MKRRRNRKAGHWVQASFLIMAVGVGAALLSPLKAEADRRAEVLKNRLIGQLEENLGIRIGYDSISPALLSAVTIRGLNVEFDNGSFVADRVRVFYNPLKRKKGNESDPVRMISRVSVVKGHLDLVVSDSGESSGWKDASMSFNPWPYLLDKTVVLTDLSADVGFGETSQVTAEGVSLGLKSDEDAVRYNIEGSVGIDADRYREKLGVVGLDLASDGVFSPSDGNLNGRLDIAAAGTDVVTLSPMSVDFTYTEKQATIRRIDDQAPIDLFARYSNGRWEVAGETVGLKIHDIVLPGPGISDWSPWFSTVVDGAFHASGNAELTEFSYGADLDIGIPEGPVPHPWQASLVMEGDESSVLVDHADVRFDRGKVSYSGLVGLDGMEPEGSLSLDIDDDLLGYPVAAEFRIETTGGTIATTPVNFEAAGLEFHDFSFLIVRGHEMYAASLIAAPSKPDDDAARRIVVDALLELGEDPVVHGFASMEGFEAAHVAKLTGLSGLSGLPFVKDSKLNLTGFFEANRKSWILSVEDAVVVQKERPGNLVRFKGRAYPGNWRVDSLRVSWDDYVVDGRISAAGDRRSGTLDGRFIIEESLYPVSGRWSEDGRIDIESDFGFSAVVGERKGRGRSLALAGEDVSIPLKDGRLVANLDARGVISDDDWHLYLNSLSLAFDERSTSAGGTLEARGTLAPGSIVLPVINIEDGLGSLAGNAVVETANAGRSIRGRIMMNGEGLEHYDLKIAKSGDIWDIGMDVTSAELARFQRDKLLGTVDVRGRMSGSLVDPKIALTLNTSDGFVDGRRFGARGSAVMESGRLRIYDVAFDHEGVSVNRGLAILDLNEGSLRSTAEMNARFNSVPVATGFSLAVDFREGLEVSELADYADLEYTGTLATRPVLWNASPHLPAFTFHFSKDGEAFRMRTPDGDTLNVEYRSESGRLDIQSAYPLPVAATGGGTVADGSIDLSFPQLEIDPVLINYVMRRDPILLQYHVVFQGGRFVGNLDIEGPAGDPDLTGRLRAQDLLVDTPYTYAAIRPASSDIVFEGNRITFEQIDIPVGGGIVYGRGYIVLDRWSLTDFNMHYGGRATSKSDGVPVYYPLLGVYLDGLFTGDVHMTGDGRRYFLDAELTFPYLKAWLGDSVTPVSQRRPGKFPTPVFLDFDFITGNNCTFFLPNEQLKIVRATAEPGRKVRLTYSTDPRNLSLTGVLPIKNGEIFYFDRDFQVTEGEMRFNETLIDFDPVLGFRAETKVRDDQGEDVTVALVYEAPVMSDFKPRIETVPTRPETEILALFGRAVIPYGESRETDANTVLLATGGMFGQVGIVQPFEDVLREGLNLDMVTIRTDIIENTLAEGLTRGGGAESTTPSSGLGRYLDNTSLYAGKYIGNALFLSGSLTASHLEGQRLRSVFGGLEFETAVSLEMETPFFNIAWSYSPDTAEERNFIEDNEISLKWQFTY